MVCMWTDERGSQVLEIAECRRLLSLGAKEGRRGHLGIPDHGTPLVLPVNATVDALTSWCGSVRGSSPGWNEPG